ncbi:MAG: hypothetical protein RL120_05200 [Gammaproteobacteria bacterium]
MQDRQIYLLLTILLLMGAALLAILLAEPAVNGGGIAHPRFPGMQAGGDGAERLAHIGSMAFLFHLLLLALITVLCIVGIARRHRSTPLMIVMLVNTLFTWLIAWQMHQSHLQFLATGETAYFLGFPTATAWGVYGTWLGAIPLIILYVAGFRRFFFTPEDAHKYQQLLDRKSRQDVQG